jgi:hypothetical protein
MTQPKQKKEEPVEKAPYEKNKLPVVPDPEVPTPEEIKLPGETGPEKLVDQMSHADGSDQGSHPDDSQQPVGLNESGRRATASSDVE